MFVPVLKYTPTELGRKLIVGTLVKDEEDYYIITKTLLDLDIVYKTDSTHNCAYIFDAFCLTKKRNYKFHFKYSHYSMKNFEILVETEK